MTLLSCAVSSAAAQSLPAIDPGANPPVIAQGVLAKEGSEPFHLKARISERPGSDPQYEVEYFWKSPTQFRRNIKGSDFIQTLIVNGDSVLDERSDDYMPAMLRGLLAAMTDARPLLATWQPGLRSSTLANGLAKESGVVCFSANCNFMTRSNEGLSEEIRVPGYWLTFTRYKEFRNLRIARLVHGSGTDRLFAEITTLESWKPNEKLLEVASNTPVSDRLKDVYLPEAEVRAAALQPLEIIWPQALDGPTKGTSSYFVTIDREGKVREVESIIYANERTRDSAERQMKRWRFKPMLRDGIPVQIETAMTFSTDTRKFGPADPLTDAEVRKLVDRPVDPVYPVGTAPSGSVYKINIAVDSDGEVIERIAGEGPLTMSRLCWDTTGKWKYHPIIQNGSPMPYRGVVECHMP
jgi:hypothetical protein